MALNKEKLNQIYQEYLGRSITDADINALGGENGPLRNMSELQFINETILPSQEFAIRQGDVAKKRYAPDIEQIGFDEEQAKKQAEISGRGLELEKKGINETKSQLEYDLEDAIKNIKKTQKEQEIGYLNRQQRLGLRPSGLTVGGLGELATETGTQISRLERTRANKLAQIALQENELTLRGEATQGALASSLRQTQIRRGRVEQNISDYKQGLIDTAKENLAKAIQNNDAEEFNRAIKLIDIAQSTPEGQEIDLGKFGKIRGTKPKPVEKPIERKTETVTAGGRQLLIDSNTGETIRDLGSAYKESIGGRSSIGGGSKVTTQLLDSAAKVFEDVDINGVNQEGGNQDKLLSRDEANIILKRLIGLTGDEQLASELFNRAWAANGYQKWNW